MAAVENVEVLTNVLGDDVESNPAFHDIAAMVATAVGFMASFQDADAAFRADAIA